MQYRTIAVSMIEDTYNLYKNHWLGSDDWCLNEELNKFDIPVWDKMDDNTKCSAMEYVYKNRNEIELHSGEVEAWVQATAYFMLMNFASMLCPNSTPELEIFFDDMDFMLDEDALEDEDVQEQFGIPKTFQNKF